MRNAKNISTDLEIDPPPTHGIHLPWLPSTARRLRNAGCNADQSFSRIKELVTDARREVSDNEIKDAVALVFRTDPETIAPAITLARRTSFDLDSLRAFARRAPAELGEDFFIVRSKYPVDRSPLFALSKLYAPGEKILIFDKFRSQGQFLWQHAGGQINFAALPTWLVNNTRSAGDRNGSWFLSAPVDGRSHPNPRTSTMSRRSEESVIRYPCIVLENDVAPRDLWLKALALLPLPIAMVTDSGGAGYHALIRSGATCKADWEANVAQIADVVITLGADPGALSAVRLTRLPNCWREKTQRWQRLLYLNDDDDDTPLVERSPR
jgi:hypothetical protein